MSMNPDYPTLKKHHRELQGELSPALSLRTYRALSWPHRAEQEKDDPDARFIFLWIAFNAAYAHELQDQMRFSETRLFYRFLSRLIESDREQLLYQIVWNVFPRSIHLLLDNPYVFQPFWEYQRGCLSEAEWKEKFIRSKTSAFRALGRMDTRKVLLVIFERLYVLRNQLFHGGATWNSSVNRDQLKQATDILGRVVPAIIAILLDNNSRLWGDPRYPMKKRDGKITIFFVPPCSSQLNPDELAWSQVKKRIDKHLKRGKPRFTFVGLGNHERSSSLRS